MRLHIIVTENTRPGTKDRYPFMAFIEGHRSDSVGIGHTPQEAAADLFTCAYVGRLAARAVQALTPPKRTT